MGDEEDRLALLGKVLHDLHQLVDLLRRQNGRRLVEDQDLVVTVQHLQDLGALLHTDGDVFHLRVEIDQQPVFVHQLLDLFARLLLLQEAELRILGAENNVVQHREYLNELEVLVYHADVERRRVVGVVDLHGLSVLADLAGLRLIQSEKDTHQCGFSCAVFTQKRVDLAFFQLQGDVVVRFDAGEFLGDVKHLNDILICLVHKRHLLSFPNSAEIYSNSIIFETARNCKIFAPHRNKKRKARKLSFFCE